MSEIKIIDFGDLDEKQEEKGKDFFDLDKLNKFIENVNKLLENLSKNKIQQIQQQNNNLNKQQVVAEVIMKFEKFLESNPNYLDMKIKDFLQFIKENRNQVINILSK
ncbi:MAG TPA: hypothetical protein EYH56_03840 [Nanoarchaeota archaeon]|nr:hypothetical protein [Nanoarchaeota archaeon]